MKFHYLVHYQAGSRNWNVRETIKKENPDWGGNWWKRYFPRCKDGDFCQAYSIPHWAYIDGVPYHEELSGPDGAHYTIFPKHNATPEEITKIKNACRHKWDVTGFTVIRQPESEAHNV